MSTPVVKRLISTEDYNKMAEIGMLKPDERLELINGEIYTKRPILSRHAAIVNQVNRILGRIMTNEYIVSIQNPVHLDELNQLEPDISVLKFQDDLYVHSHPNSNDVLVVMEVSDSTYEFDRYVKLPIYANNGVPEYWLINLKEKCIEVYEDPVLNKYRINNCYLLGDEIPVLDEMISVSQVLVIEE